MVIGHGTPLRAQQPQLGHASQFLDATPTTTTTSSGGSHQQRSESSRARDEDEIQSLASSEASESGKFSSFGSTTSERQSLRSGGAASTKMPSSANPPQSNHSSFGSHDLPLRSRDPSVDDELASGGGPRDGREPESGDYTHRVRYPNNSRILIAPLLDEEISLKGGIAGSPGVANFRDEDSVVKSKPPQSQARGEGKTATSSKDKDPFYCDRSHFDYQVPVYPSQQSYPGRSRL